jgi:hypothetical protein
LTTRQLARLWLAIVAGGLVVEICVTGWLQGCSGNFAYDYLNSI